MKKLLLILIVALVSCDKKDDPGPKYESLAGEWVYTSPDSKLDIAFTLDGSGDSYSVSSSSITYDGAVYTGHISTFNQFVEENKIGRIVLEKAKSSSSDISYRIVIQDVEPSKSNTEIKVSYVDYKIDTKGFGIIENQIIKRKP